MSNIEIRAANSAEQWAFQPKNSEIAKIPKPERSKYWDIWCKVEPILLQGDDAIIDFTNNHDMEYSISRVQNDILRLARVLKSLGEVDFKIKTETIYLLEPKSANPATFSVEGEYLQIRAFFEHKN